MWGEKWGWEQSIDRLNKEKKKSLPKVYTSSDSQYTAHRQDYERARNRVRKGKSVAAK